MTYSNVLHFLSLIRFEINKLFQYTIVEDTL